MFADDYPDQDDADNGVCLELGSRVRVYAEVEVQLPTNEPPPSFDEA